jgi:GntR family transcriptional regulator/MocR family aminotransferase
VLAAGIRINLLSDYCRASDLTGLLVGFGGPTDEELDRALAVISDALRRR